jgi:hypothetical protein
VFRRQQDGVTPAAGHPERRVGLLDRFGHDVARRHGDEASLHAPEGGLGHAPDGYLEAFQPGLALAVAVDSEPSQLRLRRGLTGAELHASLGHQVEHGDALGDAGRVVVARSGLHHAVPDAHPSGALAGRGQKHLGRAGVRVLLEEVVLHLPEVLHAQRVGQLDLVEGVGDELLLAGLGPGPGQLVLVEDAELHAGGRSVGRSA